MNPNQDLRRKEQPTPGDAKLKPEERKPIPATHQSPAPTKESQTPKK
ncbi:hypothetical protein EZS27_024473 [termite gut metagenome]|uniref:Uncharacterized protein n=1 Tax=termite gut metagenome TaxID=433724 RepID=A0A5J4QYP0_9ZZZZ